MAVGWSSDVLPVAKRMSNVAVIVPKSGTSIWVDLWVSLQTFHFTVFCWKYYIVVLHQVCHLYQVSGVWVSVHFFFV